jgi:hypothetical protein
MSTLTEQTQSTRESHPTTDSVIENKTATVGRTAPVRERPEPQGVATIAGLTKQLGITAWDAIIVGDGSGQGWDMGTGWACGLVDRYSGAAKLFYGSMNVGTVTIGEMMPYIHALLWYTDGDGPGKKRRKEALRAGRSLQIHIITDSEVVAKAGTNVTSRHAHPMLWAAYDACAAQGYTLVFHHVRRNQVNLNVLVDELSRCARQDLQGTQARAIAELQRRYPGVPSDATVYDFMQ